MSTVQERPKKQVDPQESLKREIRFWLNRINNYEFLKAVRALVRTEGVFEFAAAWDSLHPELRKAIEEGNRDIAEGRVYSSEEVFGEIEKSPGKKLNWSARAKSDLDGIVQFSRLHNGNECGDRLLQDFRQAAERVGKNELRGQRFEDANLRFVVVLSTYQVFYRIGEEQNGVVAIWNARHNPDDTKTD